MSCIQYGQPNLPLVPHPDNIPYAGKSFIVHIKHARITKFSLVEMSYVKTPSFLNSCKSSMSGCKYTSIFLVGFVEPGIRQVRNMYGFVIHILRGRL